MKKIFRKIFIPIPVTLIAGCLVSNSFSSCSTSQDVKRIDGTDWQGIKRGSFAENDYIINNKRKTVTYINGVSIGSFNLIIPDYVSVGKHKFKVLLGQKCFSHNTGLTGTIRLNNFIREIPNECFFGCASLVGIICLKKLIKIGDWAFADVPLLSHIYILQSGELDTDWASELSYIGDFAFYNAILLDGSIILGSQCYYVGDYAFNNCSNIKSVDMQFCDILVNINVGTFAASGIRDVYFPPNLQNIEDEAFRWCADLQIVHIPVKGMTLSLGRNCFFGCESLLRFTNVIKVKKLGEGCFSYDSNISFPVWQPEYELDEIPNNAFSACGFSALKFYPNGVKNICDYAFADNQNLNFLDFSEYSVEDGPPQWEGKHIFSGANFNGGTILFNDRNRFTQEWKNFFLDNNIEVGEKWRIETTPQPFKKIIEPEKKKYTVILNYSDTVALEPFSYETTDDFDEQQLVIKFNPKSTEESEHATFKLNTQIDKNNKEIKLELKISNATPGTYQGKVLFFYGATKLITQESLFTIECV